MAKLYRNATTNEYFIDTAMDGRFVTMQVDPEGREYLKQQGVEEDSRIPAEVLAVLETNGWLTEMTDGDPGALDEEVPVAATSDSDTTRVNAWAADGDDPVVNSSETNARPNQRRSVTDEPLPSTRMQPRPWMERENVERAQAETGTTMADHEQPVTTKKYSTADRENADAVRHPEAAAFVGGVWFWLLVVAVVVIAVWAVIEFV